MDSNGLCDIKLIYINSYQMNYMIVMTCLRFILGKENKSKHMKLHHVEDSPFACAVCARPFKRREAVKEHMKIHCLQVIYYKILL